MLSKVLGMAILATMLSAGLAGAQSIARLGGPSNLPPAGFGGQQFVDGRGCLFLRAGFGAAVNWVPRVDRRHKPLCGYPPTFGAAAIAAVQADMAPERQVVAARPVVVAAAPVVVEPVAPRRVAVARTAVVAAVSTAVPKPPKGYKLAWKDDRLNPLRGIGTVQGQAQQDRVWTRDVPAVLVAEQPQAAVATRARVTVSTMSAPEALAAARYVQIGSFGQPENAATVKGRLAALGLPVATSKISRGGKTLQIVYAGPFGSAAAAKAALGIARGAGFGDAILR